MLHHVDARATAHWLLPHLYGEGTIGTPAVLCSTPAVPLSGRLAFAALTGAPTHSHIQLPPLVLPWEY